GSDCPTAWRYGARRNISEEFVDGLVSEIHVWPRGGDGQVSVPVSDSIENPLHTASNVFIRL
ncbi:hypothetical protein, partial [Halococcus salifodinae]|uniref:hypothetical protein n=1 Tax=Halococcus salifodinae TaxID=36738 RepID=UPI0019D35873